MLPQVVVKALAERAVDLPQGKRRLARKAVQVGTHGMHHLDVAAPVFRRISATELEAIRFGRLLRRTESVAARCKFQFTHAAYVHGQRQFLAVQAARGGVGGHVERQVERFAPTLVPETVVEVEGRAPVFQLLLFYGYSHISIVC